MVKMKQKKTNFLSDIFLESRNTPSCQSPSWAAYFHWIFQNHSLLSTHLYVVPSPSVRGWPFVDRTNSFSRPLASDGVWQWRGPAGGGRAGGEGGQGIWFLSCWLVVLLVSLHQRGQKALFFFHSYFNFGWKEQLLNTSPSLFWLFF